MKYLIGNWKMQPCSEKKALELFQAIKSSISKKTYKENKIIICPPFPWITSISRLEQKKKNLKLGAQNVFFKEKGAYTGEVSPLMLKDLGVEYVLIGHSERREYQKEKEDILVKKSKACLQQGLNPVIFIGEKEREKRDKVLHSQLSAFIKPLQQKNAKPIIVYEPVWAISTSRNSQPASKKELKEALKTIKNILQEHNLSQIPILYGGSTDEKNITKYLSLDGIQGAVPGSTSLKPKSFSKMAHLLSNIS